eukprot:2580729-Pleurochrysis_carterae.AAC.3
MYPDNRWPTSNISATTIGMMHDVYIVGVKQCLNAFGGHLGIDCWCHYATKFQLTKVCLVHRLSGWYARDRISTRIGCTHDVIHAMHGPVIHMLCVFYAPCFIFLLTSLLIHSRRDSRAIRAFSPAGVEQANDRAAACSPLQLTRFMPEQPECTYAYDPLVSALLRPR